MKEVHRGHFGIVKCLKRAKAAVYWPGYTLQIRDMVETCSLCQENRRANSNMPLQQHPVPDYPYQVVGTDLFELDGQVYLLSVDFYSKCVCVEELQETRKKRCDSCTRKAVRRFRLSAEANFGQRSSVWKLRIQGVRETVEF